MRWALYIAWLLAGPVGAAVPVPQTPVGAASISASVLLVDDDESDNNNAAPEAKPSASDTFYRQVLQGAGLVFDTQVVRRYADGPTAEALARYRLVVWYTGASYGGNRDNTSVVSLTDEKSLRQYVNGGGAVILFSPGYLNNALGAGGAVLWERKDAAFLQEVLGIRGGRGLLQRFKGGAVVASNGATFNVPDSRTPETQFSAINPRSAQVVFASPLDPDGKGIKSVPVAVSNAVGSGHFEYVGFSFESVTANAKEAFAQLLSAVGTAGQASATVATASQSPSGIPRRGRTEALSVTGSQSEGARVFEPRRSRTDALTVAGQAVGFSPRTGHTEALTVTGVVQQ